MCYVSQGIDDKGIAIGKAREKAKIILSIYNNGFSANQLAAATNKDIEEIEAIIEGKELELT